MRETRAIPLCFSSITAGLLLGYLLITLIGSRIDLSIKPGPLVIPIGGLALLSLAWVSNLLKKNRLECIAERRALQQLQGDLQTLEHGLECSREGRFALDENMLVTSMNAAFSFITGYSSQDALGRIPVIFTSDLNPDGLYESLWQSVDSQSAWDGEIWVRKKNDEPVLIRLTLHAVIENSGHSRIYFGAFSDVTELDDARQRVNFLTTHDPITNLPNRISLREHLRDAMGRRVRLQATVAILIINVDNLGKFNETLGPILTDLLLKKVGERIRSCLRREDFIARSGSGEYTIALENSGREEASAVSARILAEFTIPFELQGALTHVSCRIGISLAPDDCTDAIALLKNANTALHAMTDIQRGEFRFFSEQIAIDARIRMDLENGLRAAIDSNSLFLEYQPQYCLRSGRLVGAEALLRWRHGAKLIPPAQFIPVAEESSLINPIGHWVLKQVIEQVAAWNSADIVSPAISVNVSGKQLMNSVVRQDLHRLISEYGIDARLLTFELTESSLMTADPEIVDVLRSIRDIGATISIDDFGTGYSSLAYLKHYPIGELKIDRSFIRDIAVHADIPLAITSAIIKMAHALDIRVVAEGVESDEQLELLRSQGCDIAQGYLLGRPMPADQLRQLIIADANANRDLIAG